MPVRERTPVKQLLSPESQRRSVVLPSKEAAGLPSSDRGNAGEGELEDAWHSRAGSAASRDFRLSFLAPKPGPTPKLRGHVSCSSMNGVGDRNKTFGLTSPGPLWLLRHFLPRVQDERLRYLSHPGACAWRCEATGDNGLILSSKALCQALN